MKKDLGKLPAIFPMPVLLIATYDELGKVDVMNAAWGQVCDMDRIILFLTESHKTVKNIKLNKAFTVALVNKDHIAEADYFGIDSGNNVLDKFERTGLKATKSSRVNAPLIEEFPLTMECEVAKFIEDDEVGFAVVGRIVNVVAEDSVLDDFGLGQGSDNFLGDSFTLGKVDHLNRTFIDGVGKQEKLKVIASGVPINASFGEVDR